MIDWLICLTMISMEFSRMKNCFSSNYIIPKSIEAYFDFIWNCVVKFSQKSARQIHGYSVAHISGNISEKWNRGVLFRFSSKNIHQIKLSRNSKFIKFKFLAFHTKNKALLIIRFKQLKEIFYFVVIDCSLLLITVALVSIFISFFLFVFSFAF